MYEYGRDSVVKVLATHVPSHWASIEARLTQAARALGAPAPEVRDVLEIDGRPAIVFERIVGPSMWDQMRAQPEECPRLLADFAATQQRIHSAGVPLAVPASVERMCAKINDAEQLPVDDRAAMDEIVRAMPRGASLLHGDFHPGNVLIGDDGVYVIDWFDASVGHPVADIVRTSLLLRAAGATDLRHLPDAQPDLLDGIHSGYVEAMSVPLKAELSRLAGWEAVTAASRLAERTDADVTGLLAMCSGDDRRPSSLSSLLSAIA